MKHPTLFPFSEYWWFYLAFTVLIGVLVTADLVLLSRRKRPLSFSEAALWSVAWVGLALLFNYGFYEYAKWALPQDPRLAAIPGFDAAREARQSALEFLTGYVVEESLSIDNLFVFVLIFRYFNVDRRLQHRVLFYGIAGAILFRGVFIALGSLLFRYHWVILVFGAFLIYTGFKLMFGDDREIDPEKNQLLRLIRRYIPITKRLQGSSFFIRDDKGKLLATPLLIVLVFVETTDIVFAVDSVPAIFAITSEPLIVFTSNMFAVLGLRSLYFLLANAVEKFYLLKYGLALVLMFIGLKMVWLNDAFGGEFPIAWSLGIIAVCVAGSIAASLLFPRKENGESPAS